MASVGAVHVRFTGNATGFVGSINQVVAALSGLNHAFNNAGNQAQNFQNNITKTSQSFAKIGTVIAAGFAGGLAAFADVEHEFNQVAKLLDPKSADEFRMGFVKLSMQVPITVSELSKIAQEVARLGITEAKTLVETTQLGTDLSAVMGEGASEAFTQIKRLTSVFGEGDDKLRETSNLVVGVADALSSNEKEIIALASRWGVFGQAIGLTKAEIIAFSGVMRAGNVQAQAGGTAIAELTKALAEALVDGGSKLKTLAKITGLTSEEFIALARNNPAEFFKKFFESTGKLIKSPEGIVAVRAALEELGLDSANVSRVIVQISGSIGVLTQATAGVKAALGNYNILSDKAKKATEGLQSQTKILGNTLKGLAFILLEDVGKSFTGIVKSISGTLQGLADLDAGTLASIQSFVKWGVEIAAVIAALYGIITAAKLVRLALLAIGPPGWTAAIITGVALIITNLETIIPVAQRVGKVLDENIFKSNKLAEAEQAVLNVRAALKAGAAEDELTKKIDDLIASKEKLVKQSIMAPVDSYSSRAAILAIDKELAKLRELQQVKESTKLQKVVGPEAPKEIDKLNTKLTDLQGRLKKVQDEQAQAGGKEVGRFKTLVKHYEDEIKKTGELIEAQRKLAEEKAKASTPPPVKPPAPTPSPATSGDGAPKTGGPIPVTGQKIYDEALKSLEKIELKFKIVGDEEERMTERSKVLKKALDDVADIADETSGPILTKLGQQYKANELALDKYTNVTKKAIEDTDKFKTNVTALTKEKQLLGVTTETVQRELSLYEQRFKELSSTSASSQQEIASVTAKIKELQITLENSKAFDRQQEILKSLSASFVEADIHSGSFKDQVSAVETKLNALGTALKGIQTKVGESSPLIDQLKTRMKQWGEELGRLKGQEDYEAALTKISEATQKAQLEFAAFGDIGALLEANFNIASMALLDFLRIFGEGHPIVVQARDDVIAAANAIEILRTGQTNYAAALKGADKDGKKYEEMWKKLASTLEDVGNKLGEVFANMIVGIKTTKEQFKEQLKEMLKALIAFVVKAIVQFIILSIVGGSAGGSFGDRVAQSFSAGAGGGFSLSATPRNAQGGVLTRPTVSRLAERGPEAVVPLQNGSIPVDIQGMGRADSRSSDQPVEVTIINVSNRNEADRLAKDKKAIINIINEDAEARGSVYRTIKAVSKAR